MLATEEWGLWKHCPESQNRFQMPCASLQESEGNWSWNQTNWALCRAVKDARLRCPPSPHPCLFSFLGAAPAWPMGSYSPDQRLNLHPPAVEAHRVLTTGLQGKSLTLVFLNFTDLHRICYQQPPPSARHSCLTGGQAVGAAGGLVSPPGVSPGVPLYLLPP